MIGLSAGVVIVALTLCGMVTVAVLRARRPPSIASRWPHTRGTVLSATVQVSQPRGARGESPLVLYAYQVNGQMFQGHRVRASGSCQAAGETVARYPAGSSVIVYYDPADPSNSALER